MGSAGVLDDVLAKIDAGRLQLTGQGGFLPEMVKAVLERGLAELTDHLGYGKGDPIGRELPNARDGFDLTVEKSNYPLQDRHLGVSTPSYIGIPRKIRASCRRPTT